MTIGYAYVDQQGKAFPDTVASTERAAMVNALVTIFGVAVYSSHADEAIKAMFKRSSPPGHGIRPVEILPVEVVEN